MLAARDRSHRVAILNEKKYLHQTRSVEFGPPFEALIAEPGERAWLTVIDDIGKHRIESEADRNRVQSAWYAVLDRRYNRRRWTIFTSEKTLDELVDQGTIDDALYGRLYEMTRGICIPFAGPDRRLNPGPLAEIGGAP
jgi:DNA replication protein DnaC